MCLGTVTSIIAKRDEVLSTAIQACIAQGLPIDTLSSAKRDYLVKFQSFYFILLKI